jgi:hypothetical protein
VGRDHGEEAVTHHGSLPWAPQVRHSARVIGIPIQGKRVRVYSHWCVVLPQAMSSPQTPSASCVLLLAGLQLRGGVMCKAPKSREALVAQQSPSPPVEWRRPRKVRRMPRGMAPLQKRCMAARPKGTGAGTGGCEEWGRALTHQPSQKQYVVKGDR